MTDYGETETGFRRKTFAEIQSDIKSGLRTRIDNRLLLDSTDWVGNAVDVFSDELDLAWQALEVCRNGFDPANAEGDLMVALAALTGTNREGPTKGTVPCNLGLEASKSWAPGELVAHVVGQPTNRWVNRDTVTSTTAGTYAAVFEAESPGAFPALTGTLTVIAETKSGWLSITNTEDAEVGADIEEIDDLRVRREDELGNEGSASAKGVKTAVLHVANVLQCRVEENDTDVEDGGIPAHGMRAIIWDGTTEDAADDAIAQSILDSRSGGIQMAGAESGTAIDANGDSVTVPFDRAAQVQLYATIEVYAPNGASETEIKQLAQAVVPGRMGAKVLFAKLQASPLDADGVEDVEDVRLGTSPAPSGQANVVPAVDEILVLDSANISVIINVTPGGSS